jgi:hypothetical protein
MVQKPKGLRGLVIKWGMATDARSADRVLLVTALVLIAVACAVPFVLGPKESKLPPQEVIDATTPPSRR